MKSDLATQHCQACEGIGHTLTREQINTLMPSLDHHWEIKSENTQISRHFNFANFYETMAFMNAIAWIANTENHHPDVNLGYNYCIVTFITHALQGLTHNDFICAAKIDRLLIA